MSLKKKLGLGVASAALGFALVGGGTWAAFNDIVDVKNTFAAGTLDLSVDPSEVFKIDKLAPGDYATKKFDLINGGSIDIKQVKMSTSYVVKNKAGDTITGADAEDFASQFKVNFLKNDGSPVGGAELIDPSTHGGTLQNKSLADLKSMTTPPDITNAFWKVIGIPIDSTDRKLAAGDTDNMEMKITFENRTQKDANGFYLQNKYQGWTIEPTFKLEAIQRDGKAR